MRLKRFVIAFAVQLLPLLTCADNGVRLLLKDGSSIGFIFADKPVVVAGVQLTMRTVHDTVSYDYDAVRRIYFADDVISTSIRGTKKNSSSNITVRNTEYGMEVYGLAKDERIEVFTTSGILVSSAKSQSSDDYVCLKLPAEQCVYIIRTSTGIKYKFIHESTLKSPLFGPSQIM